MSQFVPDSLERTQIWGQERLARPSPEVAPELLGQVLVRQMADGTCYRGRIVEVEAYGPGDPACHAYKRQTDRNRSMFGPAGHLYVYLIYGVYHCLNLVTDAEGVGSAVLVRALELEQLPDWVPDKKRGRPLRVAAGPGLLCRALRIDRTQDGWPLAIREGEAIWLESGRELIASEDIVQTIRIGLTRGIETPWRWYLRGHGAVSKR
ncbi:DNA-3-methyladenine glycosylase [Synechococcus sp. PCC 7336]|uniref:DNA-3-methyladenine glycosylase n=1 Tax=Synechococcus sp. PCC 7336 TaxID=195250 RepID=UPI0003463B36|nr:DNA-3-methyladenine glycosylase [Synechococcus sp. PCC 7336]